MLIYLVFVGVAIQLFGAISYAWETFKGRTQPNRVSWLLWAAAPLIGTAAALVAGVRLAVLPVFVAGFGPLLVLFASFRNKDAYWKLTSFDYACGAMAVLTLVIWLVTKDSLIAIIFAVLTDLFASLPTVVKSWKHPESESSSAYWTTIVSVVLGFFAIQTWHPTEYAFPFYLIFINTLIVLIIYKNKISFKK